MHRRRFLATLSSAVVASGLGRVPIARAATRSGTDTVGPAIDCHLHPLSQPLHDRVVPFVGRQGSEFRRLTGTDILAYLDRLGARRAVALSSAYLWAGMRPGETGGEFTVRPGEYENVRAENDYVAALAAAHPRRIVPFLAVNPLKPYARDELDRCAIELQMCGLKLHWWNSAVNPRDPAHLDRIHSLLERAAFHTLPVMLHFYNGRVQDFGPRDIRIFADEVLPALPGLRICFAHFLGAGNYADVVGDIVDALLQVSGECDRIDRGRLFLGLSGIFNRQARGQFAGVTDGQLRRLGGQMRDWGLGNLLWGSDNRTDYLAVTREMWPLGVDELAEVMRNDGRCFIGGPPA